MGITGICNGNILELLKINSNLLVQGSNLVKEVNAYVASIIGINKAARTTTIKPSGTTSCVLGTSSGIHAWHNDYYIRNMQCSVGDGLYTYFTAKHPYLIKIMDYQSNSAVIAVPQKAPTTAILRSDESAIDLLERVKKFNLEWVREGYNSGANHNNVSATIYIKDDEWYNVSNWIWENRKTFNGLSVLPYDGGTYKDAPFQDCSKEKYDELIDKIEKDTINLQKIVENEDGTSFTQEAACAGGLCSI